MQCFGHHHSLLHSTTPATSGASSSDVAITATESVTPRTLPHAYVSQRTSDSTVPLLLATALVHVHDHQGQRQLARALIDQGSETSSISDSLVKSLKLPTTPACVPIHGIGGKRASSAKGRTTVKLSSRVDPRFSRDVETLILPSVTSYHPSIQTVLADWTHLFGVHLADSDEASQTPVELILGAEIYAEILRDCIRRGAAGTPLAQQIALGWILIGPISNANHQKPATTAVISSHLYT